MMARIATPTAIWTASRRVRRRPAAAVRGPEKIGHVVAGEPLEGDQDEHEPMQRDLARAVACRNHQSPLCLQRLGVDAQHVAPHALERIEFGDPRARPLPDRLARRRAERQRLPRSRRRAPRRRRAERASRCAARAARAAARARSRAPGRRPRRRSARPSPRPRWRSRATPSGSLAGKDRDARADEGGGPDRPGASTRVTIALTPRAAARASSSRAKDGFAASPASTKRTSGRPLLLEKAPRPR